MASVAVAPPASCGRLVRLVKEALPSRASYKGSSGRVAVVGGCADYTGAPFFAAMSALRCGSDLALVVSHPDAAVAIKSYSPELIVQPVMGGEEDTLASWMDSTLARCSAVCVGPGLGRSPRMVADALRVVEASVAHPVPLVLDGDCLWLLSRDGHSVDLSAARRTTALTPNAMEFRRLWVRHVSGEEPPPMDVESAGGLEHGEWYSCAEVEHPGVAATAILALALGGVTVVRKSAVGVICDGTHCAVVCSPSAPRRCGGQGCGGTDVCAGSLLSPPGPPLPSLARLHRRIRCVSLAAPLCLFRLLCAEAQHTHH